MLNSSRARRAERGDRIGDPTEDPDAEPPSRWRSRCRRTTRRRTTRCARRLHAAITEYKTAIAQDPRDQLAVAGLAQVSLLAPPRGRQTICAQRRQRTAEPAAQLAVADLDVSGGHLDDAFDRLLERFPALDQPGKDAVRTRLLDYFEIAGADDPRVVAARRRLTALLY